MKTQKAILESLYSDIQQIQWTSKTIELKAITFITNLFNHFVYKYNSLDIYIPLSNEFWSNGIPGKRSHMLEVKRNIINNNILCSKNGLWSKDKRVLSFKFNNKYINNNSHYILLVVPFYNEVEINELQEIENRTKSIINNIKIKGTTSIKKGTTSIKKGTTSIANELVKGTTSIKKGTTSNIDQYIDINIDGHKQRYNIELAIDLAEQLNKELVLMNNNYYIVDNIEEWKQYKEKELSLIYQLKLFNIENNIIYVNRNETNNRLDTNLTALKSELWQFIELDNEELVEIDIVNSQFAILANIMQTDELFYELAITGKLYDYVAEKLNITRKEAKGKMFKVAFDKVKQEQDNLRELFPITMHNIDTYKKENGYKSLSNLLQKTEAKIMIDNVLLTLLKKYDVVSVHDSIRCKKSQYEIILNEIKTIFNNIQFKCTLTEKTTLNTPNEIKNKNNMNTQKKKKDLLDETKLEKIYNRIYKNIKDNYIAIDNNYYKTLSDHFINKIKNDETFRNDETFTPYFIRTMDDIIMTGNKLVKR